MASWHACGWVAGVWALSGCLPGDLLHYEACKQGEEDNDRGFAKLL